MGDLARNQVLRVKLRVITWVIIKNGQSGSHKVRFPGSDARPLALDLALDRVRFDDVT
jgi:hypothetical protein